MKNTIYPELVKQMKLHNENLMDISKLIGLNFKEQTSRRLTGEVEFTIGEVEILCKHYNMDFWKLFKRKEK
jgi:hypothetical protein